MKHKYLFILAAAFAVTFTSCMEVPEKIESEDIRNDPKATAMYIDKAVHYGYEDHDYIMFIHYSGNGTVAGVVHDPNCHCFSENKDTKGL